MKRVPPKKRKLRAKDRIPKIGCPFCWEWLPPAKTLLEAHSGDGCLGGTCSSCQASFVIDETGKRGGQALMDVRTLVCGGDWDRALAMTENVDYELKTKAYQKDAHAFSRSMQEYSYLQPKVWAAKLLEPKK
jgi:hypothetical protein